MIDKTIHRKIELKIEQALRILDHAYDEIFVCDSNYQVIYVNEACKRHYGMAPSEFIGKTHWDLVNKEYWYPTVLPRVYKEKRTITIKQTSFLGENIITTAVPIFDSKGDIEFVVMSVRDNMYEIELIREEMEKEFDLSHRIAKDLIDAADESSNMIFKSEVIGNIVEKARRFAGVDATVLINGESGTGKGLLASYIHQNSNRKKQPFLPINCAAIPEELMESELFGYSAGAFTGASEKGKYGLLQMAHSGTLFLDEIGELSMRLQAKLLHVIQEKKFIPVGGGEPVQVDVRIISATNSNLKDRVKEKSFREDLYYRLNVLDLEIPPLRKRRDDIVPLIYYYLNKFSRKYNVQPIIAKDGLKKLEAYSWPGNIRQLENVIERLVILHGEKGIEYRDLPKNILEEEQVVFDQNFDQMVAQYEKSIIQKAYQTLKSSRKVAVALGISQTRASRLINKYASYIGENRKN